MKKKIPIFKSDEEAEAFVAHEDLSNYDLSRGQFVQFEFKPKGKSISIRLSEELLLAVQKQATRDGVPYQRFIRQAIERAVAQK
jgi:predicted DNA binding CopG/RHH family protein